MIGRFLPLTERRALSSPPFLEDGMTRFKASASRPRRVLGAAVRKTQIEDIAKRRAWVERAKAHIKSQSKVAAE